MFFSFLFLACDSVDDQGTEYMIAQMSYLGCTSEHATCNFTMYGGPRAYARHVPNSSVAFDAPVVDTEVEDGTFDLDDDDFEEGDRAAYFIDPSGHGEPDSEWLRNNLTIPQIPMIADPEMVELMRKGKELRCRGVNPLAYFDPRNTDVDRLQFSYIPSTCETWTENGAILVRQNVNLPDGA